jgi:hypothetical protein
METIWKKKISVAGVGGVAALMCGILAARSSSQPAPGEVGKAQNPPNAQPAPRAAPRTDGQKMEDLIVRAIGTTNKIASMTPEQRAQWEQEMQADVLRQTLLNAGFNDPELIETLQSFLIERLRSRRPLRVTSTLLDLASGAGGGRAMKLSDAQVAALLQRLEDETEAQKVREAKAQDDLDAQIQWKTRPRLKAVLMHNGVIGESAWFARSNLFGKTPSTEIEITRFWNANAKLPPGIELPAAQGIPPARLAP